MHHLLDIIQNLPTYLAAWTQSFGPGIYAILFAVIFAETGFVVTPFLPGDSLLFAAGSLTASELMNGAGLDLTLTVLILSLAAVTGNALNYAIGRWFARRFFVDGKTRFLNPEYLKKTQGFYERHGGKTIIWTRFIPIVRTYAPFVAGLSAMPYRKFLFFNIAGGVLWIASFILAGHWFGNLPSVKSNFHLVIIAIIVISVLPAIWEFVQARRAPSMTKG
jgi:membrane-associated protein